MTEFEKAMQAYEDHFNRHYPYFVGFGFPAETDEENIAIIREAIRTNKPVEFEPEYKNDRVY